MFGKNRSMDVVEDNMDDEDVDIYVSPRRFVGRTPGPRATKQKIFEEDGGVINARGRNPSDNSISLGIENVKYNVPRGGADEDNDETHTSVRRNTILSWICVAANIVLVAISAYLFVVGVWALFAQHNGGLTAFVGVEGVGLRSPIALGVCLLIASIAGIVNALMLGVGQVAPSVVEGLQVGSRRKAFILHQVMSAITLVLFALVLMSTIPPLSQVTQSGVTSNAWRDMASRYPQKVCNFEIHHQCAGLMDLMCTTNAAGDSTACPGHYCIDGCKVGVRKSMTTINACQACSAVGYSQLLLRCKASEAHKSSSVSCRDPLRKIIRRFFLLIVVSTSIALAWTVIVVLCSILSPLLST